MIKSALKRLRATQPINRLATEVVRSAMSVFNTRSEFAIKHLHRMGVVRAELPNGRLLETWSMGDDWISNQLYWRGWDGYEPETVRPFFRLAEKAECVFDVGAHVGYFALLAGHANPQATVYAFEPLPTIYKRLAENINRNKGIQVKCVQCAISDGVGEADFFHLDRELPTSSSLSYEFMQSNNGLQKSTVKVDTLDHFVEANQIEHVDLMKIDTESTEPAVLRGAHRILTRSRPHIFCEVLPGCDTLEKLQSQLRPLGYNSHRLFAKDEPREDHSKAGGGFRNYLFSTKPASELELEA